MAVDLKSELTRPLALILGALAGLGWVLFGLSSWSAASVQKTQRLQIVNLSEKSDRLGLDLARQREAAGAIADLEAKAAALREDVTRVSQTRNDLQAELTAAQRSLASTKRDLSEADRNLQTTTQKLTDATPATDETASTGEEVSPKSKGRRRYRGRRSRSFSIRSR